MNPTVPAQAAAQVASLVAFIAAARWYVITWLNGRSRASALTALLWVHVFRYVALQVFSAERTGLPIFAAGAREIVLGDVGGAIIAFAAILLLRRQSRLAIPLACLLIAETAYDTVSNIWGGMREHLFGASSGVTWLILAFFVPLVVVSAVLLGLQLVSRRGQELGVGPAARESAWSRREPVPS
jgi:hypothetical protein